MIAGAVIGSGDLGAVLKDIALYGAGALLLSAIWLGWTLRAWWVR